MKTTINLIALALLTLVIVFTYTNKAEAGGLWSDQYCNIETTTIRIVDQNGIVVEEKTEEKVGSKTRYLLIVNYIRRRQWIGSKIVLPKEQPGMEFL